MDLNYSAEDERFRLRVRQWIAEHPPGALGSLAQKKAWQRTLYEAGYVGMGWPKAYGGQDARPMEQAIVAEEMARGDVPGAVNSLALGLIGPTLIDHGTEEQKQRYVQRMLTADDIWCQLYSEPDSGSDLASLKTRAVLEAFEDGERWIELPRSSEPAALPTEGLFAASNSSLILCGPNKKDILFATGGPAARVFRSHDDGHSWAVATTPILSGNASSGIFSIACVGRTVVAVGGDYSSPTATNSVAAYSKDLGATWHLSDQPPSGYRSAVIATGPAIWVTVGITGADTSADSGVHWTPIGHENANAVVAIGPDLVITAGPKGTINQIQIP